MSERRLCPHCKREINSQLMVCPLCGGQIPDESNKKDPICPRCKIPLEMRIYGDEEYDFCPECGGLWLDRDEFHRATIESHVFRDNNFGKKSFLKSPLPDDKRYISCVRCGKLMLRKNFARISGVIVDECSRHGVWLDSGELQKIRQFIAAGGLERAQNKEIESIRLELRDLALKVDETSFLQRTLHFWNFKRWFLSGW